MLTVKKMEKIIGIILIVGMLISSCLVFIGGSLYLIRYGHENISAEALQGSAHPISMSHIWQSALSFTPTGMIELGLLCLVFTQFMRVALLTGFYAYLRDYWFTCISAFILLALIYSFVWNM